MNKFINIFENDDIEKYLIYMKNFKDECFFDAESKIGEYYTFRMNQYPDINKIVRIVLKEHVCEYYKERGIRYKVRENKKSVDLR